MADATLTVLNPTLFTAMEKTFGHVRVSNPGIPLAGVPVPKYSRGKVRVSLDITDFGEGYNVNCPFCSDTRRRMIVNHRFGVKDPQTGSRHLELVKCFNEQCFSADYDRRKQLHATLFPDERYADEVQPLPIKPAAPARSRKAGPPPASTPLDELPDDHPARAFVQQRGLDPDVLATDFGVGYSAGDDSSAPRLYHPSLVIPVYSAGSLPNPLTDDSGDLVGWQARLLDPPSGKSKYMTAAGMPTGRVLYNLPNASRATGPLVVVEGVSDVWAVGANAVGLFGKSINAYKADLIVKHAAGRPVVVWLDADAVADAKAVANMIRTARAVSGDLSPQVVASCPQGRYDPGECTPSEVNAALTVALSGR